MWINVSSDTRSLMEVSYFAERYLVDALSIVEGVAMVRGSGRRRPAMRIWVDPKRLAARQLTVTDIEDALRRENVQMPSGRLESSTREFTLRTNTGSAIYTTFALALLIAYLVLAALFESFKHPLIIMTTVPLAITGALSRQSIGAVVFFGVSFSVLLTLVVVPSVYALLAKNTRSPEYVAQLIEGLSSASSSGQASET